MSEPIRPVDDHKILFTDMDGTLFTVDKEVSPYLKDLLYRLVQRGNRLVLSSGRTQSSIQKAIDRIGLSLPGMFLISTNGNAVYDCDEKRYLFRKTVPMDIARGVIDLAHQYNVHIQSYTDTHVVCEYDDPEIALYKKATGMDAIFSSNIMDTVGKAPAKLLAISLKSRSCLEPLRRDVLAQYGDTITALYSCDEYLEFFDKTAGKGNAVRYVCEYLNIPLSCAVAVGDAENDISMLEAAGKGAAMANADQQVKRHADFVTQKDNDHDGLAEVLLRFFDLS